MEEEFYDIRVWFRRAAETYPEYGDVAERRNAYTDVVGAFCDAYKRIRTSIVIIKIKNANI
jgi:hypothetical protein